MIDGKTEQDILAMPRSTRCSWYKTLTSTEREIAMEMVETVRQDKHSEFMVGENNPNFGKSPSEKTRAKIGAAQTGKNNSMYGMTGEKHPFFGKTHSEATRAKMSALWTGENNPNWQGGVSFEPYCHLFNDAKREEVRDRDERRCQSCGESEILNGQRLSVHHIDGNKMNSDLSNLAALCHSCNSSPDTAEKEFLIISNLSLRNEMEIFV